MVLFFDDKNTIDTLAERLYEILTEDTIIVCIGTDRSIGDSLAPMIGTLLEKNDTFNHNVYGTLKKPIHALNISASIETIKAEHPNQPILAIDAALGSPENIGQIKLRKGAIKPGAGIGKELVKVGDYALYGVVDATNEKKILLPNSIRLSFIMEMAEVISLAIVKAANNQASAFFTPEIKGEVE